jgi:ankyrin repeat protein
MSSSSADEIFDALHTLVRNLNKNIKNEEVSEMFKVTQLYYENPLLFRNLVVSSNGIKGRNHLIKTVRNGNVAWAKKVIQLLDSTENISLECNEFMGKECYICYEPFEENHIVYKVPCRGKHIFHKHCIDKWVRINSTCPYCRDHISIDDITGYINKCSETGKNVLYYAIKVGNTGFVEDLLNKGAIIQYNSASPLHLAAGFQKKDLVQLFLDKGIPIDATDERGRTPLYYAVKFADEPMVRFLLEKGANFVFKYYDQRADRSEETNAFLVAIEKARYERVIKDLLQYMIEKEIPLDCMNSRGENALTLAILNNKKYLISDLLDAGAKLPFLFSENHPLVILASCYDCNERYSGDDLEMVKLLVQKMDEMYLQSDAKQAYIAFLSRLFANFCKSDYEGQYAELFLGGYPLVLTDALGDEESEVFYNRIANPNYFAKVCTYSSITDLFQCSAFFFKCVERNNLQAVKLYIEKGYDVSVRGPLGNTAIHFLKSMDMLKLLEGQKIDFTAVNMNNETAIHKLFHTKEHSGESEPLSYRTTARQPHNTLNTLNDDDDEEEIPLPPPPRQRAVVRRVRPLLRPEFQTRPLSVFERAEEEQEATDEETDVQPVPVPRKNMVTTKKRVLTVREKMLNFYIEKGVNINALNNYGFSALQMSSYDNDFPLFHALLEKGANVNECSKQVSPLYNIMCRNHAPTEIREKYIIDLINAGAECTGFIDNETVMHFAFVNGMVKLILKLMDKGLSVNSYNKNGQTPLGVIAGGALSDFSILRKLQDAIHEEKQQFIQQEVPEEAPVREEVNVNLPSNGLYPIHRATQFRDLKNLRILLSFHPDLTVCNSEGLNVLHMAVREANLEMLQLLEEHGADLKVLTSKGESLLFFNESSEMLDYLISKGLDVNHRDQEGYTVLHRLLTKRSFDRIMTRRLMERGANPNIPSYTGHSILHTTTHHGEYRYKDIIDLLKEFNMNLNMQTNEEKYTPLHQCIKYADLFHAKVLVRAGADHTIPDTSGITPLLLAAQTGYTSLTNLMLFGNEKGIDTKKEEVKEEVEEVDEEITLEIEVDDSITVEEAGAFIEAQDFDENARTIRLVRLNGVITAVVSSRVGQ